MFGKRYYFLMFQIRQPLVIARGERAADYFFHDRCFAIRLEFFECVIVSGAIDKFDVDGYISFTDKQIVIECPADPTVAVNKWMRVFECQVQTGDPSYDMFMTRGIVFCYHLFHEFGNFGCVGRDMSTYAYTLLALAESSGDFIADIGNEHFM